MKYLLIKEFRQWPRLNAGQMYLVVRNTRTGRYLIENIYSITQKELDTHFKLM